jgi:class 3 adenylate cyclase
VQNNAVEMTQQKSKLVVMFADICESTALYDLLGDELALHVISLTLNIMIQEVAAQKGTLIKTIGDEIMCTFLSITKATCAASAMHIAIDAQRPGGEHAIHLRIGYHYGEVIRKGNDIFGDTVNVAARVTSITRARQIMMTQAVVDSLPSDYEDKIRPILRTELKGKQDAIAIYQYLWNSENEPSDRIDDTTYCKPKENKILNFSAAT